MDNPSVKDVKLVAEFVMLPNVQITVTVIVNTVNQMIKILVLNVYKNIELQNQTACSVNQDISKYKVPKHVLNVVLIVTHAKITNNVQNTVLTNAFIVPQKTKILVLNAYIVPEYQKKIANANLDIMKTLIYFNQLVSDVIIELANFVTIMVVLNLVTTNAEAVMP